MSFLLFGAGGQIGWELKRALAPLGPIAIPSRAEADFSDPSGPVRCIRRLRPSWVVNAAAYTAVDKAESEPQLARRINAETVGAIARAATDVGARTIHYSTDYVFDGAKGAPYREDDRPAPLGTYGRTKLEGDDAVAAAGGVFLVLRTQWVYSERRSNFARTILGAAASRTDLSVVADQYGAPTAAALIADVTSHIVGRLTGTPGEPSVSGIYHLTASGSTSWHGFADYLISGALARGADLACAPDKVAAIPTTAWPTPAPRPLDSRLSTHKLETTFGLVMPDWRWHAERFLDNLYGAIPTGAAP